MEIRYQDLAGRLSKEAESLFRQMVELHQGSTGDRVFLLSRVMGPNFMSFRSSDRAGRIENLDMGALQDLTGYGLLQEDYGSGNRRDPVYRVGSEGQAFYAWLVAQRGEAVAQVEGQVLGHLLDGAEFARRHPNAAHHLGEAFALLWQGSDSDQAISEVGDHLRKAIMDAVSDVAGDGGKSEYPAERVKALVAARADRIGAREGAVLESLADLTEKVTKLDHRLNHIRDENDKGNPLRAWDEARRAAFVSALLCYEVDRLNP